MYFEPEIVPFIIIFVHTDLNGSWKEVAIHHAPLFTGQRDKGDIISVVSILNKINLWFINTHLIVSFSI